MRITILWSELSGYLNTCLRTLTEEHQVVLQIFRIRRDKSSASHHPYTETLFEWMPELHTLPNGSLDEYELIEAEASRFQPDLLLISGWTQPAYLRLAKAMRKQGVYVICGGVDNQWQGTLKQRLGILMARWRLHPYFDALWTPGQRAAQFARKLGYSESRNLEGFYACDYESFAPIGQWRLNQQGTAAWPHRFLYTGRLTEGKGVRDLLAAYTAYRPRATQPWELWIAGSGPLASVVEETPHVRLLGFVQPEEYADLLKETGAFILPSHFEPWGVVVQEAMAAGLPVICSQACGSSDELVEVGRNGYVFPIGNEHALTELLCAISSDDQRVGHMGAVSFQMAKKYTPSKWAEALVTHWREHTRSAL